MFVLVVSVVGLLLCLQWCSHNWWYSTLWGCSLWIGTGDLQHSLNVTYLSSFVEVLICRFVIGTFHLLLSNYLSTCALPVPFLLCAMWLNIRWHVSVQSPRLRVSLHPRPCRFTAYCVKCLNRLQTIFLGGSYQCSVSACWSHGVSLLHTSHGIN